MTTLSELLRLQEKANEIGPHGPCASGEALMQFQVAARHFDFKKLSEQYEAMRAFILGGTMRETTYGPRPQPGATHLSNCAVVGWREKYPGGPEAWGAKYPDCDCGLDALRASLDTKARGDGK